jgi:hypothetical protein
MRINENTWEERRKFQRTPTAREVLVNINEIKVVAKIKNFSDEGISIEIPWKLYGRLNKVSLFFGYRWLEGTVIWHSVNPPLMTLGIKVQFPKGIERYRIQKFLESPIVERVIKSSF